VTKSQQIREYLAPYAGRECPTPALTIARNTGCGHGIVYRIANCYRVEFARSEKKTASITVKVCLAPNRKIIKTPKIVIPDAVIRDVGWEAGQSVTIRNENGRLIVEKTK